MPVQVQGTFVSQKISKIRWIPEDYVDTKCFFTGSWDDVQNSVKVWSFDSENEEEDVEYPHPISEFNIEGDITEIKFVDKNRIAVSSSDGDARLLEISVYDKRTPLKELFVWNKLHNFGSEQCSCTALDVLEGDVTTAGEDGSINILSSRRGEVIRSIRSGDSCSLHSICFIKHSEVMTGNVRGHMKIWDIRTPTDKCAASFLMSGDEMAVTYIINHPTQPHIILAGSESGSVAVWDLRVNTYPASLLNAHMSSVTELQFHPENPQKLFSCSSAGEIWDWNMEKMTKSSNGPVAQSMTTWTPLEDKTNVMVNSLMPTLHKPINTLHCHKSRVLCGADNEAVYLIKNVNY